MLNGELCKFHGKMPYCDKHWQLAEDAYVKRPLFTTKHYKAIAGVVKNIDRDLGNYFGFSSQDKEVKAKIWRDIVGEMSNYFSEDNPKFKVSQFLKLINKS